MQEQVTEYRPDITKAELPRKPFTRTKAPKRERAKNVLKHNPLAILREKNNRSFFHFFQVFWKEISNDPLVVNWHMEALCKELQQIAETVGARQPKKHDLLFNLPPGTTKTKICMVAFPAWCWTRWYWMQFLTVSYNKDLALESAEECRDLIKSDTFQKIYPDIRVREDKEGKSNYKVVKLVDGIGVRRQKKVLQGGRRFSTGVTGMMTGMHGHINLGDDLLNPHQSNSEKETETANRFVDETLSTRKTDKKVSTTVIIGQRVHKNDPSGHLLKKGKTNLRHICLPGHLKNDEIKALVKPQEWTKHYKDNLLDAVRLDREVLHEMEKDLGQYGYHAQIDQNPTPPGEGMFNTAMITTIETMPPKPQIVDIVRYWDKAGSQGTGAYTAGGKLAKLRNGTYIIMDIKRGQWSSNVREGIIKATAQGDTTGVRIGIEQEPGSGGKESAEASVRRLAGFSVQKDRPTGDKIYRADPFSVAVNNGDVKMLRGAWNDDLLTEMDDFPFGNYKDQIDCLSGAFAMLTKKRPGGPI